MKVCAKFDQLPESVKWQTGLHSVCNADWAKLCSDPTFGPVLCPPGGKIITSLCEVIPEKCDDKSSEYRRCASDWSECIYDSTWNFCHSFPELCPRNATMPINNSTNSTYGPRDEGHLREMICNADSGKFCRGTRDPVINDVCGSYNMLPTEIKNSTSIFSICQADLEKMCTDSKLKP